MVACIKSANMIIEDSVWVYDGDHGAETVFLKNRDASDLRP